MLESVWKSTTTSVIGNCGAIAVSVVSIRFRCKFRRQSFNFVVALVFLVYTSVLIFLGFHFSSKIMECSMSRPLSLEPRTEDSEGDEGLLNSLLLGHDSAVKSSASFTDKSETVSEMEIKLFHQSSIGDFAKVGHASQLL
jgi:hypothetical protein